MPDRTPGPDPTPGPTTPDRAPAPGTPDPHPTGGPAPSDRPAPAGGPADPDPGPGPAPAGRFGGARGLGVTVVAVLAAAGLALWLGTRPWLVELVHRPDPLPVQRVTHTGAENMPWLTAAAIVAMAGAGALLATRGLGRRLVGGLLVLAGLGVLAASGYGLDAEGVARVLLPAGNALGGLVLCAAGVVALRWGAGWPTMGARYERGAEQKDDMWSALDRGEDPTRPDGHHIS
ncbi:Trp biosynthesis-associated membrane protein [Longispora sp. K20-0274]|uniref:Trp biosynthesis-associated membrane protein n=1 Tax=Longispora sp. K20-0274 TaxID=3088255 RepID=UPI00399BDF55